MDGGHPRLHFLGMKDTVASPSGAAGLVAAPWAGAEAGKLRGIACACAERWVTMDDTLLRLLVMVVAV